MAQHYAPEEISGAILATELATGLVHRDHQVTLVTCAPSYPKGEVFPGYRNALVHKETMDGVQVIRTWSYISPLKSFWRRILNYGTFSAGAFVGGLLGGRPDVVLSYSPPLPLGMAAWLLSRLWRVPWILRVEDIYPEAAINLGVLRNPLAIRFFSAMERFLYRRATHISVLSEGFRRNLMDKGVPPEKLSIIPVWANPDTVRPGPKQNRFRDRFHLDEDFVVLYAGNIGHTAALEGVLDAAAALRSQPGLRFLLVGEGVRKDSLEAAAQARGLDNVTFLPFQPRALFSEMLAAADVALVTLNRDSARSSFPSKTFNYMASGRPILAVAPDDSEMAEVIRRAACGVTVPLDRPDLLAETILRLMADPGSLADMGRNGRAELESTFASDRCVDLFEQVCRNVLP